MKKYLFTSIVCLLILSFTGIKNEKYSFRDLAFETSIDSISGMTLIEDGGNTKFYVRESDTLKIGENKLESIHYGFYKGKLSSIIIKTTGYTNSRGVLDVLNENYGTPYRPNQFMDDYDWFGKKLTIMYDENSATNNASIYFFSKPMADLEKADKKQSAKNSSGL